MNEAEMDAAFAENLERGFMKAVGDDRYTLTPRGARYVELMRVRASMPQLAELIGGLVIADPQGEVFAALLQELKASMCWDEWPGLETVRATPSPPRGEAQED